MKLIIILLALAAVAFFVSKKLKSRKKTTPLKTVTPKAPVKKKPASNPAVDVLSEDKNYYKKNRQAL